jgi:hypothetical protein
MQKKYAKEGLAAISVCLVEQTSDVKKVSEKALAYLKKWQATFDNVVLNEDAKVWQKNLGIDGPPCIYVFNRDGKIAKKFDAGEKYDEVEKLVAELLKK